MTKLRAPMFSFEARGAIAESIVYFPWKGIAVARKYVIPTNPQTTAQLIHRAFMRAAVAAIHAAQGLVANPLVEDDITAMSQLSLTLPTPLTWFNMITKLWLDSKVAGDVPIVYHAGTISDPDRSSFDCHILIAEETTPSLAAGHYFIGVTRTALIHSFAATVNAGVSVTLVNQNFSAWMVAGQKYYIQFRPDAADPCEGADSGIYNFVAT